MKELLSAFGASPDLISVLNGLLSESPEVQQSQAGLISGNWQNVMAHLRMAVTWCYSSSYYLAGILMIICVVIAVIFFRQGRQTEEAETAETV
jgi:hypothetical protein